MRWLLNVLLVLRGQQGFTVTNVSTDRDSESMREPSGGGVQTFSSPPFVSTGSELFSVNFVATVDHHYHTLSVGLVSKYLFFLATTL